MSVFTHVQPKVLQKWIENYSVGSLLEIHPIVHGVQNSNYRLVSSEGTWILTLFEDISFAQAENYVQLLQHLYAFHLPVPLPLRQLSGTVVDWLHDRPAALVQFCSGAMQSEPDTVHLQALGSVLASLHQAMRSWSDPPLHPKNYAWRVQAASEIRSQLSGADRELVDWAASIDLGQQKALCTDHWSPQLVHADLFRDNVLWDGEHLTAVLDFYGAGTDVRVYDLAVVLNDWCRDVRGVLDPSKAGVFLTSYHRIQPLSTQELQALPDFLVLSALRFFLSRSLAWPGNTDSANILRKDPQEFRTMLQNLLEFEYRRLYFAELAGAVVTER